MLFNTASLAVAAASIAAAAPAPLEKRAGVFTSQVRKHVIPDTNSTHILRSDAARIARYQSSKTGSAKRAVSSDVTNSVVSYLAEIGFGTPATDYSLIVDTGSSNTWAEGFKVTSDAKSTGQSFSVTYGSGSVSGTEYTDTITLASGLVLKNQGVGRGTRDSGFTGVDGILGVGPEDLTSGTTSGGAEIPTVMQTAKSQGLISANVLGVYFAPTSTDSSDNGELTYGGTDSSRYTGSITYQAKTTSSPSSEYWGLTITSSLASTSRSGIVDTGTTLVYLPSDWYSAYTRAIPSATTDSSSGLLRFPKSSLSSVPDITFTIGGKGFVFNKYAQLVEQGLYSDFGLSSNYYYSWVGNYGTSSGLSLIIGQKFLERYYSVFDTDSNRIGFATTANSLPTTVP